MRVRNFKLIFFTFLFAIYFFNCSAQKIEYSAQPIDNYSFDYLRIAGYDDNGFFLLQSNLPLDEERDRVGFKSRKFKVSYFTSDLNEKWTKQFDKGEEGNRIESIGVVNGSVVTVKSKFNDREDKSIVTVNKLDSKGNETLATITIGEIPFEHSSELDKIKFVSSLHHTRFGFVQVVLCFFVMFLYIEDK